MAHRSRQCRVSACRQIRRATERRRGRAAIDRVGLARFAEALPKQLSGGMAQRTALARALVTRPKMLLMDEPFSALDPLTRERQQDHLLDVLGRDRPTVLFVTHDIDEALALADRVVLLAGPPGHIVLDQPVNLAGRRPPRRGFPSSAPAAASRARRSRAGLRRPLTPLRGA